MDELLKRTAENAHSAVADIEKSHQAGENRTDPVYDKIAHRIQEAGFLHVEPEGLIHCEFEDFPAGSKCHCDAECDEGEG